MRNRRRGYAAARVRAPRVVARLGIVRLADSDAITPVPPLRPWVVHVAEPGIVFRDGAYARAVGVLHAKGHLGELDRWGALEEPVGLAASAPRVREKDNDTEEGAAARESAAAVFFELTGIGVDSLAE
ncbi:MAG: hypothetical protein LBV34_02880, partial [Nocardiopsaceae bacterium]|nr:hypothetical protein [Nocardiopsaceae bacterium]